MIIDTLGRVGQVLNFRLVYDKDTGRPKGFGFAEFADADAAASAVRNLNDYEVMGRKLRVDWSNDNGAGDAAPVGYTSQPTNGQPDIPVPQQSTMLPPLPPGVDPAPDLTCPEAISRTLSTLPPSQLLDILSQMKALVMAEPAKATELLRQAPQLSYAIFQSLLLLNLVDSNILSEIIEQATAAAAPAAPAPQPTPIQPPVQQQRQFQGYAPHPVPTPPVPQQQYQPAPPVAPPQMSPEELFRAVMAMPQHQIDALPPDQRMQILAARQMMAAQQQQAR